METTLIQSAISIEEMDHEIKVSMLMLETLQTGLTYAVSLQQQVDAGELSVESAVENIKLVTQDFSLEAAIFQHGSPVHRLISAIMQTINKIIDRTKDLVKKLFSARGQLGKKAVEIRDIIKNKSDASEWVKGRVELDMHAPTLMNGRDPLNVIEVMSGIRDQAMAANNLAVNTGKYFNHFDDIAIKAEKNKAHWIGDDMLFDKLFGEYMKRIDYDRRKPSIAGLPINDSLLGSKIIKVTTEFDDDGRYVNGISVSTLGSVKIKSFDALDHRDAVGLCSVVVETISDVDHFEQSRKAMSEALDNYRRALDRIYKIFYQGNMNTNLSNTMTARVKSLTQRDISKDIVKVVMDLDKNVYRACLSSLIWIDKSLK